MKPEERESEMRSKVVAIMMVSAVVGLASSAVYAACGSCGPQDDKHKHGKQDKACAEKKTCDVKADDKACVVKKDCDVAKKECPEGKKVCTPQKTCPVMGGKVNKEQYVDVEGYRVYVCCPGCKSKIKENPEKYIEKIKENDETPIKVAWLKKGECDKDAECSMKEGKKGCPVGEAKAKKQAEKKCCGSRAA